MTTEQSPPRDEDADIQKKWRDALDSDVREIMSGQIRALSSVNGNLLILLVNLSSLLVAKGILTQEELKQTIEPHMKPQPGDLVELHRIRENMYEQFLKGVEVVSESLARRDNQRDG